MPILERLFLEIPVSLGSRVRIMLYKMMGASLGSQNRFERIRVRHCSRIKVGSNNAITSGTWLYPYVGESTPAGSLLTIGSGNFINRDCFFDACHNITIGNNCAFGPNVYITDSDHSFGPEISPLQAPTTSAPVIIGDHCWVGAGAKILKGVELGDHCVVAAGAVVTKSFPPASLIGGIPARLLRNLSGSDKNGAKDN